MSEDFDINNPTVGEDTAPDYDPTAPPKSIRPAPKPDGYHKIRVWLDNSKEEPVYIKEIKDSSGQTIAKKVLAAVVARFDEGDDKLGGFLKNFYPSATPVKPGGGAQLPFICHMAGNTMKAGLKPEKIKEHVVETFAQAGEAGIKLLARTRWVMSFPKTDEQGMPVYKAGSEYKEYVEIKGMERIQKGALARANQETIEWQIGDDESQEDFAARKQAYLQDAIDTAHIFADPLTGDERVVQPEIWELVNPKEYGVTL